MRLRVGRAALEILGLYNSTSVMIANALLKEFIFPCICLLWLISLPFCVDLQPHKQYEVECELVMQVGKNRFSFP